MNPDWTPPVPPAPPHKKGTAPTHELIAKEKDGPARGVVAVGWEDENGISFVLLIGVTLSWKDELYLRVRAKRKASKEEET
jgi:hypothetical protein